MTPLPEAGVQALARLLLADEAGGAGVSADAAERAFEKLRLHLSKVLGPEGFRVLVRRAVTLAQAEFPWLRIVEVRSDGSLTGLSAAAAAARTDGSVAEADGGIVATLAHFLGLLEAFLGPDLTRRLVHSVWPEADALSPDAGRDPLGTSSTGSDKNEMHVRPDETMGRGTR